MKRIVMLCAFVLLWAAVLDVNVSAAYLKDMAKESASGNVSRTEILKTNRKQGNIVPAGLAEIPAEYYSAAEQQGTLAELYYNTYESMTYDQKTQQLNKRAIVYLPYGYDEGKKYNVFYLMHGGWGNETTTLGTPERPSAFKNVIDHAIESGEFAPLIIVCPTYNNTSPQDSADFSLALRLNQNYHNELLNDLIPAVEGTYSTYAKSVSPEDLMAARDHRGFGGFSMGFVATWRTFQYCLDYFRYFLPMSCGTTLDDANIFAAAEGHDQSDYFVWTITGTEDFAYSYVESRVGRMRNSQYFTEADGEGNGNFAYRVKEGYSHDGMASMEYTYNGLRLFWNMEETKQETEIFYTADTKISDVRNDPDFGDYGRLIFPVNEGYYSGDTLEDLRLTWYTGIDPDKTVEIVNYMKNHAKAGDKIFYDIYTDEEKAADPAKKNTGLFFFKGTAGGRFAICNAGGGFAYVGAMHDSFPHALELSKKGYNAFALIYRPGVQTACEDLARAISFIFRHADELEINTDCYSLWGGSAGARMAANLGSYGSVAYGGDDLPRPGTVVMQYTGHSEYTENDPPTYVCVGTNDGIANWQTMQRRIQALDAVGIPTEFHAYEGLPHGFGLGTGTIAEGWMNDAVAFWEKQMGETVPEEGHKVHTIVKVPAEEASCTEEGKTEGEYCSVCHEVLKEQETIPAVGHSFRKDVISASEKQNGTIITKCAKCGTVENETVIYAVDKIELTKTSYTYNGKSRKPSVNVTDSKGNVLKEGTDYTVSYPKDMKNVGTYTVTVNFKNYYTGNAKRTVTVVPKPTSISKVTTNKKGITVKWKKRVNQVTGYEISYSSSSKFAKSKTTSIKVKGSKKTTKKISKIKMGKKYYVRIRTYKTVGKRTYYSKWSGKKSVKTKK